MASTAEKQAYDRTRYLGRREKLLAAKRAEYCPHNERRKNLHRFYRITVDDFNRLLANQEGKCGICGTSDPVTGRWKQFAVDHDHDTGEVRGLLCGKCNVGLGALGDSEAGLLRALEYIRG